MNAARIRHDDDVAQLYVQVPREGKLCGVGITDHAVYRWWERIARYPGRLSRNDRFVVAERILAAIPGAEMYPKRQHHDGQETWYLTDYQAELRVARNLGKFPLYPLDVFDFVVVTVLRGVP